MSKIDEMLSGKKKTERKGIKGAIKKAVWLRDCGRKYYGKCKACGERVDKDNFELGHNIAVANGGSDKVSNLVVMCRTCNRSQGTLSLAEFKEELGVKTDSSTSDEEYEEELEEPTTDDALNIALGVSKTKKKKGKPDLSGSDWI